MTLSHHWLRGGEKNRDLFGVGAIYESSLAPFWKVDTAPTIGLIGLRDLRRSLMGAPCKMVGGQTSPLSEKVWH